MPLDSTAAFRSVPQNSAAFRSHSDTEAQARAFACRLDVLLGLQDERVEDALLAIGELLGGLGCKGFAADLRSHLDRLEADEIENASPQDISRGKGGNDPDSWISGRLEHRIAEMRAVDARDWHDSALSILDAAMVSA